MKTKFKIGERVRITSISMHRNPEYIGKFAIVTNCAHHPANIAEQKEFKLYLYKVVCDDKYFWQWEEELKSIEEERIQKLKKNIRMKIVAISDTHNKHKNITIPEGDVIVHAGDISSMGYKHEVIHFFEWFSKLPHTHKILIAGNHDFFFQLPESIVKEILPQNITYLYDEEVIIDGIKFWGSPYTPIFGSWAFMESRPELEERWKNIPNDVNVLITHGPPYGILDYEIGDKELKNRLMTIPTNPKAHIFGHIHEGYGIDTKGVTKFINASILNEKYEVVNQPIIIEI